MPTARELLEQADALMRRNRAAAESARNDAPAANVAWSAPVPGSTSPRTIQREPIPPSAARTSLPVDPTDSPIFSQPPSASPDPTTRQRLPVPPRRPSLQADPPSPAEDVMPLLTQPIEAASDDDVPLLTDVVEEIDVPIADDADQGQPSIWDLATRGEASVLGRGPDSVSAQPAVDVPLVPPQGRDPLGLDQPAPGFEATPFVDEPPPEPETSAPTEAEPDVDGRPGDESVEAAQAMPPVDSLPRGEAIVVADEWSPVDENTLPPPVDASQPTPLPVALAASATSEADVARIREIAEEIGMQVLQRIDIFSDTTLPAQLGERLKPVVERASADLVAAINQHVGEILRAYIAEAISREIESWRQGRQDR